jgi:hypothetical protein
MQLCSVPTPKSTFATAKKYQILEKSILSQNKISDNVLQTYLARVNFAKCLSGIFTCRKAALAFLSTPGANVIKLFTALSYEF